jgi:hypothetical protein
MNLALLLCLLTFRDDIPDGRAAPVELYVNCKPASGSRKRDTRHWFRGQR